MNDKIGLIGVGNMGTAIVHGLLKKGIFFSADVYVYDKVKEKAAAFASEYKVHQAKDNKELGSVCDVLILAVKPQDLNETVREFDMGNYRAKLVISILAGVTIERIRKAFSIPVRIIRAMPNLPAKTGEGITAITSTDAKALSSGEKFFSGCGKVVQLEEKYFDLVTAISGSGPAYFFLLMELLTNEGIKNGLKASDAQLLAVQTALGAARLAADALGKQTPGELREMVTSKGGTTEAALKIFEQKQFSETVKQAVEAAVNRGKELAKG